MRDMSFLNKAGSSPEKEYKQVMYKVNNSFFSDERVANVYCELKNNLSFSKCHVEKINELSTSEVIDYFRKNEGRLQPDVRLKLKAIIDRI